MICFVWSHSNEKYTHYISYNLDISALIQVYGGDNVIPYFLFVNW